MPDPRLPRHGAIILAAGRSQRLGQSKQLLRIDGESLVHRATRFSLASKPLECLVVSRADDSEIALALGDLPCRIVPCADAADGLSASLRCGLLALDPRCDGALIVLTDQPAISAAHLAALCVRWRGDPLRHGQRLLGDDRGAGDPATRVVCKPDREYARSWRA